MKVKFKIKYLGKNILYLAIIEQSPLNVYFNKDFHSGYWNFIKVAVCSVFEFTDDKLYLLGSSDFKRKHRYCLIDFENKKSVIKFISFLKNLDNKKKIIKYSSYKRISLRRDFDISSIYHFDTTSMDYVKNVIKKSIKMKSLQQLREQHLKI